VNAGSLSEVVIQAALSRAEIQPLDMQGGLTCAAVLIPLLRVENQWHLLFTRRTDRVETHKGQVAFPGGACDPTDAHITSTALRETHEEIGVPPDNIHVLGNMRPMPTVTGFLVTPVVGIMRWPVPLHLAEHEVSRVFHVPLTWLMDPANHAERPYTRSNGTSEMVVFYMPYDGETIWGVTGRIVSDFIALISHPV
jgi:8-oxo-dGTP pyrophosphatase MutT (NUDIX family)